jgi:hypothetical protein
MEQKEEKYFLKKRIDFQDGNFVDKDTELKKVSSISDGYFKVECIEDDVKRTFWVKEENLIKKVKKTKKDESFIG